MEKLVMTGAVIDQNSLDIRQHNPARPNAKGKVHGRFFDHQVQTLRRRLNLNTDQWWSQLFGGLVGLTDGHHGIKNHIGRTPVGQYL